MRTFLISFFLILSTHILAQNGIRIKMDTKPVGSTIRISKYLGDMEIPLDSLRYRGESEIFFAYDSRYTDGVYVIDIHTLESFQFVLINRENITASIYESGSGMAFRPKESTENDVFNIMLNLSDKYSASMDSLNRATSYLSDFSHRHTAISDSLTNVYYRIANAYNNSLDLVINLFPESYTTNVLIPLDRIPLRSQKEDWSIAFDNDPAFNHVHYFNYIDFSDARIITNPFLANKVLDYLYNYTERSEEGVRESVDKLLGMPNINPKVQGFIIDLLVDFFVEKEAADFVDYINRTYLGNCELPIPEKTMEKIRSMVKFQPGDQVPELKIKDESGKNVALPELNGDLNVVIFWASWCPHCIREIPKLKELYDEMEGKLGVYAISVDTSKTDWTNAISENKLEWLNVNDLQGWDSKSLETFGVSSTPALILLDKNLRWVGRASSFDGLRELVSAQLAE